MQQQPEMNSDQVRKSPRLQQKEKEKPKPSPMGKGSKTATVGSDDVEMKPALSAQEEQQNLVLLGKLSLANGCL